MHCTYDQSFHYSFSSASQATWRARTWTDMSETELAWQTAVLRTAQYSRTPLRTLCTYYTVHILYSVRGGTWSYRLPFSIHHAMYSVYNWMLAHTRRWTRGERQALIRALSICSFWRPTNNFNLTQPHTVLTPPHLPHSQAPKTISRPVNNTVTPGSYCSIPQFN